MEDNKNETNREADADAAQGRLPLQIPASEVEGALNETAAMRPGPGFASREVMQSEDVNESVATGGSVREDQDISSKGSTDNVQSRSKHAASVQCASSEPFPSATKQAGSKKMPTVMADDVDCSVQSLPTATQADTRVRAPGAYAEGGPAPFSIRNMLDRDNRTESLESRTELLSNIDLSSSRGNSIFDVHMMEGLAIANPVTLEQRNLPLAQELDLERGGKAPTSDSKVSSRGNGRNDGPWMILYWLGGVLILCAITLLVVFLVSRNESGGAEKVTNVPSQAPTRFSVQDYVSGLLPEFTIEALANLDSPQSSAMEWLVNDPVLKRSDVLVLPYPDWRILQRFSLASFYFSTGGPDDWFFNKNWLNYSHHECEWFSKSISMGHSINSTYEHPTSGCDDEKEDGVYRHIWLFKNGLNGKLPDDFFYGLTSLENIFLYSNEIEGPLPSHISRMTSLRKIHMTRTSLGGSLPTELGLVSTLEYMHLYDAQLTGTVPSELGLLSNMDYLYINANELLVGSLPTELGLLNNLTILSFYKNSMTGAIPSALGQLSNMQQCYLNGNAFSSSIPTEICRLTGLREFDVAHNMLTGSFPSHQLGLLEGLEELLASENALSGTLPTELGLLESLVQLDLRGNDFSGVIPVSALQSMTSLELLDLSQNFLTGQLPSALPHGLQTLAAWGNDLIENLPSELGLLSNLTTLLVQENQLTGSLPDLPPSLSKLNVTSNLLTGSIPDSLCSLESLGFDCSELCGCGCSCPPS